MKICEECVAFKNCDTPKIFVRMMREFAAEEREDIANKEYISQLITDFVKYRRGNIAPSLVNYTRKFFGV